MNAWRGAAGLGATLAMLSLLAGCPATATPCPQSAMSLDRLVAQYNANADAVPRLWAEVTLVVKAADKNGVPYTWGSALLPPNGNLLLAKGKDPLGPHYFLLRGKETGQEVFRVASSPDEGLYYCLVRMGEKSTLWKGRQELAGGPGIKELPIDPNQLLSVLGVFPLPRDFTKLPTVAMDMSTQPCAYVVSYIDRQPVSQRILFRRQVYFRWSDREPVRPFRVDLLSDEGRRVLTADLRSYGPIAGAGNAEMPRDIRIDWVHTPGRGAEVKSIRMIISHPKTTGEFDAVEASHLPEGLPQGIEVIDVDTHLTKGKAK